MDHQLLAIGNVLQGATVFLGLYGYVPMWQLILRAKRSDGVSLQSLLIWLISSCLAFGYAAIQFQANGTGHALLITCTLNILVLAATMSLALYYRHFPRLQS